MSGFEHFIEKKMRHSYKTWPNQSLKGVLAHARKECDEIEKEINDADEWVDLILLGIDGASRCGLGPHSLVERIWNKQNINEARTWPTPATPDSPGEHDRTIPD